MRKKVLIAICVLVWISIGLKAQVDFKKMQSQAAFRQKIDEIAKTTKTLECLFNQEKQLSFMTEKIASKGAFYFNKDNKLRWEYMEPFDYAIILKENKTIILDNGKRNEVNMSNETFQEISNMLKKSLQGNVLNETDKFSHELLENAEYAIIRLKPVTRQIKEFLSRIDIYFDKTDYLVSRIDMYEGEDLTTIRFNSCKINDPIPDRLFNQ